MGLIARPPALSARPLEALHTLPPPAVAPGSLDGAPRAPLRCDIAVVGAGPTGLACAELLGAAGVRTVLIDARGPGAGAARAATALRASGIAPPYAQLVAALGRTRAHALWTLTRPTAAPAGVASAGAAPNGLLHLALNEQEAEALRRSAALLSEAGLPGSLREGEALRQLSPALADTIELGLFDPEAGAFDLVGELAAQTARLDALDAVTRLDGWRVSGLESGAGERLQVASLSGQHATVDAELVILCCGAWTSALLPTLRDGLLPVAMETRTLARSGGLPGPALGLRSGWVWLVGQPEGLAISGCRWAAGPEMGAGVDRDDALDERVEAMQHRVADTVLEGPLGGVQRAARGIACFGCDGLPVVGQMPGQPRRWVAAGFAGQGLTLGPAAGRYLARAALGERPSAVEQVGFGMMEPRRFLA